jgi:hypothetical protein
MRFDELSVDLSVVSPNGNNEEALCKSYPVLSIDGSGDDGHQQDVGIHCREDSQTSQVAGRQRQGQV